MHLTLSYLDLKRIRFFHIQLKVKVFVFNDRSFKLALHVYYDILRNISWAVILKRIHTFLVFLHFNTYFFELRKNQAISYYTSHKRLHKHTATKPIITSNSIRNSQIWANIRQTPKKNSSPAESQQILNIFLLITPKRL